MGKLPGASGGDVGAPGVSQRGSVEGVLWGLDSSCSASYNSNSDFGGTY